MPVILTWLGSLIASSIGAWVVSALISLGVGFVTYKLGVAPAESAIRGYFAGTGPMVAYIGWFGIDQAITIVFSALVGRMAVGAARAHLVKKA